MQELQAMQKVNGIARHLLSEELVAAAGSSGFLAPLQSTWCHPDFTSSLEAQEDVPEVSGNRASCSLPSLLSLGTLSSVGPFSTQQLPWEAAAGIKCVHSPSWQEPQ